MAAIPPLSHPKYPLPIDVRLKLPDPTTPWKIGDRIMGEMSAQEGAPYRKVEVLQDDPEWNFVWEMFHHDKPVRWDMKGVYCVHEPHQTRSFEINLVTQDREADKFTPTWHNEPRAAQRGQAIDRWRKTTEPFSPFQTMESGGRTEPLTKVHVLPLWHGSSYEVCASVAETGFTFFGKKSIGPKSAGDPKSTDEGFFGSGIYFTNSARYAADIYSTGHLLLAWVSAREPFPVVGDPKQTDMQTLQGRGAYKHYNAHYIPVCPQEMSALCAMYFPCTEGQTAVCDEVVVFQKAQTLPRFWVVLEPSALHLMQPKASPSKWEAMIPALTSGGPPVKPPWKTPAKPKNDFFRTLRVDNTKEDWSRATWSSDGKRILSSYLISKKLDIWDVESGKRIKTFSIQNSSFLRLSPDSTEYLVYVKVERFALFRWLFVQDQKSPDNFEHNVCIFDTETGALKKTLKGHTDQVGGATWHPNGKSALTGSYDKIIRLWDISSGKIRKIFNGHTNWVNAVAWNSEGTQILSGSSDKTARLWDAETGKILHTFEHEGSPDHVSFSPNGLYALSSGRTFKGVHIWNVSTGVLLKVFGGAAGPSAWSPDGKMIAAGFTNGHISVRSFEDNKLLKGFKLNDEVRSISWSPKGDQFVTGDQTGAVLIIKVK